MYSHPLVLALAFFFASSAGAQICPTPAVDADHSYGHDLSGIGDGCTLKANYGGLEFDASYMAEIAAFEDKFTPSCRRHDQCLTQIGNTVDGCNSEFYELMRGACDDAFRPLSPNLPGLPRLPHPLNVACRDAAFKYYTAVKNHVTENMHTGFLRASQAAARQVANDMANGVCGTTPERTLLYSQQFYDSTVRTFQENAGRPPTPFEFFTIANSLEMSDSLTWTPAVIAWAAWDRQFMPPDAGFVVNRTWSGISLTANAPGAEYLWFVNGRRSGEQTLQLTTGTPMYDTNYRITGFLKTTLNGVSNLSLVDLSIRVRGECASKRGQICR